MTDGVPQGERPGYGETVIESIGLLADPQLISARRSIERGDLPLGQSELDALLARIGESPLALALRAEIDVQRRDFAAAARRFARALARAPNYLAAPHGLAYSQFSENMLADALTSVDRMLQLDPANIPARLLKAAIHANAGDHDLAALLYQGMLGERPGHVPTLLGLGHNLRTVGEIEGAVAAYREAVACNPACGEAWAHLGNLKTYVFVDHEMSAMLDLAQRQDLPPSERMFLNYALGKAFFDRSDDERSFAHYAAANGIARGGSQDASLAMARQTLPWAERSIAALGPRGRAALPTEPGPIFIVGMPRSGTTLVEQILGSHSQIESTAELPYLDVIGRRLMNPEIDLTAIDFDACAAEYLERANIHRKSGKAIFVDKLPINFRHVALIQAMFPQARIVDVRRHPLASCVAMFRQHFLGMPELSGTPAQLALAWRNYAAAMDRFGSALPGFVHRLHYERLVEDTEGEVRRLLDYIGVPFEPSCLRWFDNGQPVRTPSSEQVRQPIFRSGLDAWRRFDPYLAEAGTVLARELAAYPA